MGEPVQKLQQSFEEAAVAVEALLRPFNASLFRARASCYDQASATALEVQACLEKADASSPVERASTAFSEGAQRVMTSWETCHDGVAKKMRDKYAPHATAESELPAAKEAELQKDYARRWSPACLLQQGAWPG